MYNSYSRYVFSLIFLICCSFSSAFAAPLQYENCYVDTLEVIVVSPSGKDVKDTKAMSGKLKTRAGDTFMQLNFDCDLKLLSAEYDRIEPSLTPCGENNLAIVIKVWPKPLIRSICWEGNCNISTSDLKSELAINACTPFDRQAFNKAFHKLQAYYIKKGYFESQLDYEVDYDDCTNQVDIIVKVCEGRSGRIKDIILCNFTKCEKEELMCMMVTKKYFLLSGWLTGEGIYHEEAIQHDKMVILNYLQNKGYADADVKIEMNELNCSNKIILRITALKGDPYCIGKVSFKGNCVFDNETVREIIGLYSGDPYAPEDIHDAVQTLTRVYGRKGYIDTFVNFESSLRCNENVYDLRFTIEEGDQYRVGMIKVIGNCVTDTNVILNEVLLIPGQLFDSQGLCKTEERLRNIGYFKRVNVYAVRPEESGVLPCNFRNVHVEVEEDSTGNISAFGGYSTAESLFIGLNITERNFNHRGLANLFCGECRGLRGGGEYAHTTVSVGARSRKALFSWTKPFFNDTLWSVGFDLEGNNNRYVSDDYNINTVSLTLHATYDVNAFVKTGVHYRIGYTGIQTNACASEELVHEAKNSGLTSAVGASWMYDNTNHPQFPTEGFRSKLEGECAGIGGKQSFLSAAYINSYYLPIGPFDPRGRLILRADFRFIQPYGHTSADEVPIEERFFLGGDEVVRGYRPYFLGPQFKVDKCHCNAIDADAGHSGHAHKIKTHHKMRKKLVTTKVDGEEVTDWVYYSPVSDNDPTGGLSLQYYSLEYARPFSSKFEGFAFTDFGQLSSRRFAFGHLYASIGFGARIKALASMPPVTVGMGFPVNPRTRSDVKRFFFTIGGKF